MSIQSIQSKYPSAIWFDSNYSGTNSGTLAQPYNDLDVAIAASDTNAKVIAIKDGSHTVSQIGGSGASSTFTFAGTANKLSLVGESTDAVLNFSGADFGTVINFRGLTTGAIHLETLKVFQNSNNNNYAAIFGANDSASTVTIEGCIIELGALTLAKPDNNYGLIRGAATEVTTLTITDSVILSGSNVNVSTNYGVITTNAGGSGFHTFDCQRNTIINVEGKAQRLVADGSFGTSSTYKNNIFVGLTNTELLGFTPTVSGGNCFHNTGITSGNGGVVFADPQFVDSANGDYRLRPSSPCIGSINKLSEKDELESEYPQGKWFDSNAAAGGDGAWDTPYNNYAAAINSFTGDEAVVLIKEGQHQLQQGYWDGTSFSYTIDLPKVYSDGIKFIGMGSGSVFTSDTAVTSYCAFWAQANISNPNLRDTPFLFKDFDILLNNSTAIGRGLIGARRAEYINVNVTQAENLGTINSQLFDYMTTAGANNSGEYLKMTGCTINVSISDNTTNTSYLVGTGAGLKQFSNCTFADLNRTTSLTNLGSPDNFLQYSFGSYPGSYLENCIIYSKTSNTTIFGTSSSFNFDIENVVVYSTQASVSISSVWSDKITVVDPKFVAAEPHGFDLRLRPNSALIGGTKTPHPGSVWVSNTAGTGGSGTYEDPFNFGSLADAITAAGSNGDIVFKNGSYTNTSLGNFLFNDVSTTTNQVNFHAETPGKVEFTSNGQIKFGDSTFSPSVAATYHNLIFTSTSTGSDIITINQLSTDTDVKHSFSGCKFKAAIFLENSGLATYPRARFNGCTFSCTGSSYIFEQRNGSTDPPVLVFKNCLLHNYEASSAGSNTALLRRPGHLTLDATIAVDYFDICTSLVDGITSLTVKNCSFVLGNGSKLGNDNGNLGLDPEFIDPSKGNFSLRPNSPLIGING
jgi:hypothetical protein